MSQISLVGAGPGPLELLTLRALHRIEAAEVVVYDRLVGSEILARIPQGAARSGIRGQATSAIRPRTVAGSEVPRRSRAR